MTNHMGKTHKQMLYDELDALARQYPHARTPAEIVGLNDTIEAVWRAFGGRSDDQTDSKETCPCP